MARWFRVTVIRSALLIIGETLPNGANPVRLFPAVSESYDAINTAVRQTLNNTHITSAFFPTRTASDLPPGDPVADDVGPFCDTLGEVVVGPPKSPALGLLSDVPAAVLKKLDGIPVGGSCGDPVVALSVGLFPALGTTVPDSVTVGTLRGYPYSAHSSAKSISNPVRHPTGGTLALCTTGNEGAESTGEDGRNSTV
jgi:hypothetical protein